MTDVDDPHSLITQSADDNKQLFYFSVVECRCRLVHYQHTAFITECLGNLDHLLTSNGQCMHRRYRIHLQIHRLEYCHSLTIQRSLIKPAKTQSRFTTNKNILRGGQISHQAQLLMNDVYACVLSIARPREVHSLADHLDLPGITGIDARQYFHQSRLAGTVLSHQGVNLSSLQIKLHIFKCMYSWKTLLDTAHTN